MSTNCIICPYDKLTTELLNQSSLLCVKNNHVNVKFKKGDSIIKQGTFSTNIMFLRSGLAKIHIKGPHSEQIIKLVKAPRYLGLPTTIGDKINQYSVTALSPVNVCFSDIEFFKKLLAENKDFSYNIILELCKNELASFQRCANRTQKQTRGNIATFLLDLSNDIYESLTFSLPLTRAEIGNLTDTTRESVSRVFSEFQRDNIIELNGKKLTILNYKSLDLIGKNG